MRIHSRRISARIAPESEMQELALQTQPEL